MTPEIVQEFAKYNQWQNQSLYKAAEKCGSVQRRLNHGAFFDGIHQTLQHILWADELWMHRFEGKSDKDFQTDLPDDDRDEYPWQDLCRKRINFDEYIIGWANGLQATDLDGDIEWFSGAIQRDVTKPKWLCIQYMFNHQTHHRGQVHAMLTKTLGVAGAGLDDTDMIFRDI